MSHSVSRGVPSANAARGHSASSGIAQPSSALVYIIICVNVIIFQHYCQAAGGLTSTSDGHIINSAVELQTRRSVAAAIIEFFLHLSSLLCLIVGNSTTETHIFPSLTEQYAKMCYKTKRRHSSSEQSSTGDGVTLICNASHTDDDTFSQLMAANSSSRSRLSANCSSSHVRLTTLNSSLSFTSQQQQNHHDCWTEPERKSLFSRTFLPMISNNYYHRFAFR